MNTPLFLLGAGFNLDANKEAGYHDGYNKNDILSPQVFGHVGYPLTNNLKRFCFPSKNNTVTSIEELFNNAIKNNNYDPIRKLCNKINCADAIIIPKLLPKSQDPNCYLDFFTRFKSSSFLTFNYDALVEIFLYRLNHWSPHDGFGCQMESNYYGTKEEKNNILNKILVIHLHGSLNILTSKFDIVEERTNYTLVKPKEASFIFDPQTPLFHPKYDSVSPKVTFENIENRIIAPVPDKTEGLKKDFINKMYSKAIELIINTDQIIVIGYNFSEHDKSSYDSLLKEYNRKILIISPNADEIKNRLKDGYRKIQWNTENISFKNWVNSGFKGLN